MTVEVAATVFVIAVALVFDFTNGFHDAANAIATPVATGALRPRTALVIAALLNFVGAFLGQKVAQTIQSITDPESGVSGLALVFGALLGAIAWNLITWWFGIPSSSSHALIGGIVGSALVVGAAVNWSAVLEKVVIPMLLSPVVGFVLAYLLMRLFEELFWEKDPRAVGRRFRHGQRFSAAAMSLGHGLQDAQKTMGVIVLLLVTMGYLPEDAGIPAWVVAACALSISLGTAFGGFKIMKTLGGRVIDLDPVRGFAAESVSASILYVSAYGFAAPVSTTQTVTGSILGAGAEKRRSAVRWGVGVNILWAWVLTLPMAALMAALCHFVTKLVLGV